MKDATPAPGFRLIFAMQIGYVVDPMTVIGFGFRY
jgi:hypothetical protein